MIDIKTYITEGGFFANIGANKYIDTIKNFGDIIATGVSQKEFNKSGWISKMPKTKVYKKLYDLFNDINKYEVSFDRIYRATTSVLGAPDICTEHWTGIRNGDEFSLSYDRSYEAHPEENRSGFITCEDVSDLLSTILYYIQGARRSDIIRTAKFTIK